MARELLGIDPIEIPGGHFPMAEDPAGLSDLLELSFSFTSRRRPHLGVAGLWEIEDRSDAGREIVVLEWSCEVAVAHVTDRVRHAPDVESDDGRSTSQGL